MALACLLLAPLLPAATDATEDDPEENGWIMHRMDPPPGTGRYGGYNSLAPADFNGDGFLDYAVIHEFLGWIGVTILFHPGAEEGAVHDFWEKVEIYEGKHVEHAAAGDFDMDGQPDILVVEGSEHGGSAQTRILFSPGPAKAGDPKAWKRMDIGSMGTKTANALYASAHDIDGDGDLDAFIGGRGTTHGFEKGQEFYGLRWAECPDEDRRNPEKWKVHAIDEKLLSGHGHIFVDLDEDGDADIVVNNADFNTDKGERALLWYENPGAEKVREPWAVHVIDKDDDYFMKCGVDAGDLDGDGGLDLVIPLGNRKILWFQKSGNDPVKFRRVEITKPEIVEQVQRPIQIVDVNQDGKMDLLGAHLHYAYHTRYGHDAGYFSPDKASIFWMEFEGDAPGPDNWKAHCVKRAFGSNTGRSAQGEKMDHVWLIDMDRDGDQDIIANSEESYVHRDGGVHTYFGVAWFENAATTTPVTDSFETDTLSGGEGWASAWDVNDGDVKIVSKEMAGSKAMQISEGAVITRALSKPIDHGQLEFRWLPEGKVSFRVEVFDGEWQLSNIVHSGPRGEESLPYKNEMLSLARFGPVSKIRISLQEGKGKLYLDDFRIRVRVDGK